MSDWQYMARVLDGDDHEYEVFALAQSPNDAAEMCATGEAHSKKGDGTYEIRVIGTHPVYGRRVHDYTVDIDIEVNANAFLDKEWGGRNPDAIEYEAKRQAEPDLRDEDDAPQVAAP